MDRRLVLCVETPSLFSKLGILTPAIPGPFLW
jgi:hypothetical protein